MEASIVRWNRVDVDYSGFDGYILPGGFSYEDRVRGGAIAASEPVMGLLMEQAAAGKPVVGICNGAQVLVECGLVPGIERCRVDLALAANKGMGRDGYYSNWVFLKATSERRTAITCGIEPEEVLPLPIAHSQGRFTSSDNDMMKKLDASGQIVLRYCRADGSTAEGFPDDPNGSDFQAAAISNPEGNVVAMMPHPERAAWLRQVPGDLDSPWSERRLSDRSVAAMDDQGPGARVFRSLMRYIEEYLS
jgi:phosphoribosylformylglycinamidine synthase